METIVRQHLQTPLDYAKECKHSNVCHKKLVKQLTNHLWECEDGQRHWVEKRIINYNY